MNYKNPLFWISYYTYLTYYTYLAKPFHCLFLGWRWCKKCRIWWAPVGLYSLCVISTYFLVTLRVRLGYTPKEDKIEIFCTRFRKTADLVEPTFKVSIFAILLEKLDRNITLVSCSNASGSITQSGADEKDLKSIGLRSPAMANQQACNTIQQQPSRLKYLINRDSLEGVQLHCYYQETLPVLKRNARAQLTILKLPGNESSPVLFLHLVRYRSPCPISPFYPTGLKIYTELNLATWLRWVKFTQLNFSKFWFFNFNLYM